MLKLYTRLALNVKTRQDKELEIECFAARLWDQQDKMHITTEELAYSTTLICLMSCVNLISRRSCRFCL